MIKRALISVSDKTGIIEFAKELEKRGIEIISTGGTAKKLKEAGLNIIGISDVTGFPECLDGRVKTLHPNVHGGLLAIRDNKEHMEQLGRLNIKTIDLLVVNLYPFKETILKGNVELEEAIENIDIGGPTMLRAAAKNYQDVAVVIDPEDYNIILNELDASGDISKKVKFKLAYKVFEHTSHYDTLISKYLKDKLEEEFFPKTLSITFEKVQDLRYGENPHQKAVFYKEIGPNVGCLTSAKQLHGKELSFNNINDANGAIEIVKEFKDATAVAVKHANPCGVGSAKTLFEAYLKAYEADPVSIYGGIVALNRELDGETAKEISKTFLEIIIAPSFSKDALEILTKKKNLRLLELENISTAIPSGTYDMKKVAGGLLVQDYNSDIIDDNQLKFVTKRKPDDDELEDLIFAMKVVKHTKSNGITTARNKQSIGIGPGQTNRVMSAKIAIEYGKEKNVGAVLASDAYIPFVDNIDEIAKAGIKAIIQPGGSIRDQEVLEACDKHGIAMVYTGIRHFKH